MENDGGGWTLVSNFRDTSNNCQPNAVGTLTSPRQTSHARLSDDIIRNLQGDSSGHFGGSIMTQMKSYFGGIEEGAPNRLFYSKKTHSAGGMKSGNLHEKSIVKRSMVLWTLRIQLVVVLIDTVWRHGILMLAPRF